MEAINCLEFDSERNSRKPSVIIRGEPNCTQTLNVLNICTFNVLKDTLDSKFVEFFVDSPRRFDYQLNHLLPTLDFDIIGLNEVTPNYYKLILNNAKYNKYYISELHTAIKQEHYNIILSKHPFKSYCLIAEGSENIIGLFKLENKRAVIIVSSHFLAFESEEKMKIRELQFSALLLQMEQYSRTEGADPLFKLAYDQKNIIMMGDFNYHLIGETQFIYKQGFVDLWVEKNGLDLSEGFTWDSNTNSLIELLLFENRRMRLDRIILHSESSLFRQIDSMSIIGVNPIPRRYFGKIHSSDHYGLACNLKIDTSSSELYQSKLSKDQVLHFYKNRKDLNKTGYRAFPSIIGYRILFLVGMIVLVLGLILYNII